METTIPGRDPSGSGSHPADQAGARLGASRFDPSRGFGQNIIVEPNALAESDERLFAASRHRSRRIRKKLLKRFGGEFRKVPAVYRVGERFIMHPALYAELKRTTINLNGESK